MVFSWLSLSRLNTFFIIFLGILISSRLFLMHLEHLEFFNIFDIAELATFLLFSIQNNKISLSIKNPLGFFILSMGLLAQNTQLSPQQVVQVKKILYLINLGFNKGINTPEEFIKFFGARMTCGGKEYQHIVHTLYPNILFSKSSLQEAFPTIKSQFSAKPYYTLSDLYNYKCIQRLQKEQVFADSNLSLELAPEVGERMLLTDSCKLSLLQTKQRYADILWMCLAFRKYLDEKKGIYGSMSGHVHFADKSIMPEEARKLVLSQLNSIKVLSKESKCFEGLLNDLSGIVGNPNLSWEQRNLMFQETFRRYIPILPENKMPSFLFSTSYSYNDQQIMNDRRSNNMYTTTDSFANIENSQNTLAIAISQHKFSSKNFIQSPLGCKKIKQIILENNKAEFSSWSGWSDTILD